MQKLTLDKKNKQEVEKKTLFCLLYHWNFVILQPKIHILYI